MGYFNPSTINTTLYNIVLDKKIADDVYKVQRPASVDDKVTSFIVVYKNCKQYRGRPLRSLRERRNNGYGYFVCKGIAWEHISVCHGCVE